MRNITVAALVAALPSSAFAMQTDTTTEPVAAQSVPVAALAPSAMPQHSLPANTEIMLSVNEELNTRRNEEGEAFNLTVVSDVMLGGYIVIPRGTRAVGEITWMTGRGMFGKSGKMDVELRYIDLNGRRIPITGTYRQEGEGNTVATIAGVVLIPVAGLFITGHSGVIPAGRELTAHTVEPLPVILPTGASIEAPVGVVALPPGSVITPPRSAPATRAPARPVFPGAVVPDGAVGADADNDGGN